MKYSADEIDRMRRACRTLVFFDSGGYRAMPQVSWAETELAAERRLVTYMANGTWCTALEAHVDKRQAEEGELERKRQEYATVINERLRAQGLPPLRI